MPYHDFLAHHSAAQVAELLDVHPQTARRWQRDPATVGPPWRQLMGLYENGHIVPAPVRRFLRFDIADKLIIEHCHHLTINELRTFLWSAEQYFIERGWTPAADDKRLPRLASVPAYRRGDPSPASVHPLVQHGSGDPERTPVDAPRRSANLKRD